MLTDIQAKEIRTFIKSNFSDYTFYNNKKSVKIQFPNSYLSQLTNFLESKNIPYTHSTPMFVMRNFGRLYDWDEIRIQK